jgi:DNA-binding response OmpR family regulator
MGGKRTLGVAAESGFFLRERPATLLASNRSERAFPQSSGSNMHAFIIEDEYLIGQSVGNMLEKLGFTSFSFARSEDAAIAGANTEAIDLITADVRLLPGDGVRAVEKICEKRAIPVVFITGYLEELQDRAPTAIVVQKPVRENELAAAVDNALRERRADS